MDVVNYAISQPQGDPLAMRAMNALRSLGSRVSEFIPAEGERPPNPSRFDLIRVVHAMRRGNALQRAKAAVALQEFMNAPDYAARRWRGQVFEMVTKADFPSNTHLGMYIDRFLVTPPEMDRGYEMIFQIHDFAEAEGMPLKGEFRLLDVENGITFKKLARGERVEFRRISGKEVIVPYDLFGGGLSIERTWWDDQDFIAVADVITMFRTKYFDDRAGNFYGLITGLGAGINFNTGADLTAKINGACADILRKTRDKGYGSNTGSKFIVLCAPERRAEVDAAIQIRTDVAQQTAAGKQRLVYRLEPISTTHVPAAGAGSGVYVILPNQKLRGGYRMPLTLFGDMDIAVYAESLAGFGRYAGIVGDSDQVRRIP